MDGLYQDRCISATMRFVKIKTIIEFFFIVIQDYLLGDQQHRESHRYHEHPTGEKEMMPINTS